MNEKRIQNILHRVLEEKLQEIKLTEERASILNHQIQNFEGMAARYQKDVLRDLMVDLSKYGWNEMLKEIEAAYVALDG